MSKINYNKYKSKHDIQNTLCVSMATVNNWIKTGLIPNPHNQYGFTEIEFKNIIKEVISFESNKLKSRANRLMTYKNFTCFVGITDEYIKNQLLKAVSIHKQSGLSIERSVCAISIIYLKSANMLNYNWITNPKTNIELFLISWVEEINSQIQDDLSNYIEIEIGNTNEDFIGAFYQSIQSISSKSKKGSYYTPSQLIDKIKVPLNKTVLDPCCGSGGILLKVLQKTHDSSQIYARDIDETALKICRINLCLFFKNPNITPNIKKYDIIFDKETDTNKDKFDFIITNPPWGSKFSNDNKEQIFKKYPMLYTSESFSIALFNSINKLSKTGTLVFFLPHSFLNVSTHKNIRKFLINKKPEMTIYLLGKAFCGVMSESIRLEINFREKIDYINIFSADNKPLNKINYSSLIQPDYIISATAKGADFDIISKIMYKKHLLLKNNAKFALGIVTGNNAKHILSNPTNNSEPIYRGKDIKYFCYKNPERFIEFNPNIYQQVAPIELYRQPKIVYRFISDKIVCVLDKDNRLILNSANLFIPTIKYPFESIVALFNSKLYTFLYRKLYHSKKVLRSHIESLPLPIIDTIEHNALKELNEKYIANGKKISMINNKIYEIYNLTNAEISVVEGI